MNELWALLGILVAAIGGLFAFGRSKTKQGKRNAESDQARRENETNRRVADAQEANRRDDISERRKRLFGDSENGE